MNFYDKKIGTPFMFRDCIIRVLDHFKEKRYVHIQVTVIVHIQIWDQYMTWHFAFSRKKYLALICYCVRTDDEFGSDSTRIRYLFTYHFDVWNKLFADDVTMRGKLSNKWNRWPVPVPCWRHRDDEVQDSQPPGHDKKSGTFGFTYLDGVKVDYH